MLTLEPKRAGRHASHDLAALLLRAQDDERRRVAQELHDDLSQRIAKLQFDIDLLGDCRQEADTSCRIKCLREQVATLAEEVRRIAHGMHPSTIDNLGLVIALRSYCRDFAVREGMPVRFRAVDMPRHVPAEIGNGLYRIVQEALRNAAKHAGKASVTVSLKSVEGELQLRIRDNGKGFQAARVRGKGGIGLASMEERVRLMNGKFEIVSLPKPGVTIAIRVPAATCGASV